MHYNLLTLKLIYTAVQWQVLALEQFILHVANGQRFLGRRGGANCTRLPTSWCIRMASFISTTQGLTSACHRTTVWIEEPRQKTMNSRWLIISAIVCVSTLKEKHHLKMLRSKTWFQEIKLTKTIIHPSQLLNFPFLRQTFIFNIDILFTK